MSYSTLLLQSHLETWIPISMDDLIQDWNTYKPKKKTCFEKLYNGRLGCTFCLVVALVSAIVLSLYGSAINQNLSINSTGLSRGLSACVHPYLISGVTGHSFSDIYSVVILSLIYLQYDWPRLRNDFMFLLSVLAHYWELHFQRDSELSSIVEMMIQ